MDSLSKEGSGISFNSNAHFSGIVHMQALLELGSWSREVTSARVFWPYDKRFLCVLCGEDSAAWSKLLFPFGQTGFQWHLVWHEKPFQSGLFWQNVLVYRSSLWSFLWHSDFSSDHVPYIGMARAWLVYGAWVVVYIAPLTASELPWPHSGFI